MKRRHILMGGAAILSTPVFSKYSIAQTAGAPDASRLGQDLTPFGAEKAGSASGLIPAWTGGISAADAPAGWDPKSGPADLFAGEKPLFSVTQANMGQYAHMLTEGQKNMLTRFGGDGFRMDVYPCHRTASAPQYVYDNAVKNVTRAQAVPAGIVAGITGVIGGTPFPFLSSDPATAGVQAMWNHATRWQSYFFTITLAEYVIGNGTRSLTDAEVYYNRMNYYDPAATPETAARYFNQALIEFTAPPNSIGGKFYTGISLSPLAVPNVAFEYLVGEGRVREAPATQYDVPETEEGDAINYDEANLFYGAFDRFTWKLVGKQETIVPYHEQTMFTTPDDLLGDKFQNPDRVRYEVHRCWVVEATVAPGARMTDAFRRFYIDEDTWTILVSDLYDSQGRYWRYAEQYVIAHPQLPGTFNTGTTFYNLQQNEYATALPYFKLPLSAGGTPGYDFSPLAPGLFEPQMMANSGGL